MGEMLNNRYLVIVLFILLVSALMYGSNVRYAFAMDAELVDSPSDHISIDDLKVFSDKAVIDKENLRWARILDTHSMEPVLNKDSVSLELVPSSVSDIEVGDIISFSSEDMVIIHRVVLIGEDNLGWYAVTKGDNVNDPDPYKVRFSDVKGVVVGILY